MDLLNALAPKDVVPEGVHKLPKRIAVAEERRFKP